MPPMTGPTPQERYHLVAPLPPLGGWRRTLALDRRGSQSGPVVLSFAPHALAEDAARLAVLSRDAEAGARVHHPNVLSVLGLEAVDEELALVERAGQAPAHVVEGLEALDGAPQLAEQLLQVHLRVSVRFT